MDLDQIISVLEPHGLLARGTFKPDQDDGLAADIRAVVIVGNAGSALWPAFSSAPEFNNETNPMDSWTRRVIGAAAEKLGAEAAYPFDGPPYIPFQRWAAKADAVWPSPIGPLIHADYGLWHAYRGALLFEELIEVRPVSSEGSPCENCLERPCLSTCPVGAFSVRGYDVPACAEHLNSGAGLDCMNGGCLARRSCPVGQDYLYAPDHAAFHMDHFLKARPKT